MAQQLSPEGEWGSGRIPVFRSSERAVKALSAMNRYRLKISRLGCTINTKVSRKIDNQK